MRASSLRARADPRASTLRFFARAQLRALRRRARATTLARAVALSCTLAAGCIPSHRLVHEGDVYFERCYGADFTAAVDLQQKEACWQAWIAHYTKHQPAHRVDYALARIESLQNGEPAPVLPGLVAGALPPSEVRRELEAADAAAGNTTAALLSPLMQGDGGAVPNGCAHFCADFENQCRARCDPAGPTCDTGCQRERAVCLNGCH